MVKYLENLLYQKTFGTQSEILYAHWSFDKIIIPKALSAISTLFPHYSLHDESHSISIINNIIRVLGKEKLDKLSAIDIWLILEVSYCHDLGMIVSSEKLVSALKTSEFLNFFEEIQQDKSNGLNEFAMQFKIEDGRIEYNSIELNLHYHDGIKFILAEFFRRNHAERSKDLILNPDEELKISSPRSVIPQRIFKIMADICSSHTKSFDEVMKLPFSEMGLEIENSHPRFISCLLRIGDLLDLDNNRFSEVMLRTLGKIPVETLHHKTKHLSIESLRVDNKIIDVRAKCNDYEAAILTQHWLNYLNSEINNQKIQWNNIVPLKEFGYLPSIGSLIVKLDNYEFIDGKKKFQFSVEIDKAMELLQGAGIYEGAYKSIREILQNSVDATLLEIWKENQNYDNNIFSEPNSPEFKNIIKQYAIEISINEKRMDGQDKVWEFIVKDSGIGLSMEDLDFLMNTGSSIKNKRKNKIINEMPVWLRPSGIFGIGFQSIFMLTDQVKLETKSFFNQELYMIELNSPNSSKNGSILLEKLASNYNIKPGTKLSFEYKTKAIPDKWSINSEQKNANRILNNFDPFSYNSLDIELGKIIDELFLFASKSCIPIKIILNQVEIKTQTSDINFKYFDDKNSLELNILEIGKDPSYRTYIYYKNQYIDSILNYSKFLAFEINIHNSKASKVLELNRNKIRQEYTKELIQQIYTSLFRIVIGKFNELFVDQKNKILGSMFLDYYKNQYEQYEFLNEFDISGFNQWEEYHFQIGENNIKIGDLISSTKTLKIKNVPNSRSRIAGIHCFDDKFIFDGKELTVELFAGSPSCAYTIFLFSKLRKKMALSKIYDDSEGFQTVCYTKIGNTSHIDISILERIIINLKKSCWTSRWIIPCPNEFIKLRILDEASEVMVSQYKMEEFLNCPYPKMLSPFVCVLDIDSRKKNIEYRINDNLLDWVLKNRYDQDTTLEDIKTHYNNFVSRFNLESINRAD